MTRVRRHVYAYSVKRQRIPLASDQAEIYAGAVTNPVTVAAIFRATIGDPIQEHFVAFYLDGANRITGYETIAIGGCTSVEVEPANVFRGALLAGAVRLIVAHNHPSGLPSPSDSDIELTARLVAAGKLIGIPILDHVIVTANEQYSFASVGAF